MGRLRMGKCRVEGFTDIKMVQNMKVILEIIDSRDNAQ